jgi:hypothetical protein
LLEDAVLVAQAVAHCWKFKRGRGFHEAGRETAEAAVAEARVWLLFQQVNEIEIAFTDEVFDKRMEPKIRDIISQRTSDRNSIDR